MTKNLYLDDVSFITNSQGANSHQSRPPPGARIPPLRWRSGRSGPIQGRAIFAAFSMGTALPTADQIDVQLTYHPRTRREKPFGMISGQQKQALSKLQSLSAWSRRPDSNWRPAVYETAALPLSHVGLRRVPESHLKVDWILSKRGVDGQSSRAIGKTSLGQVVSHPKPNRCEPAGTILPAQASYFCRTTFEMLRMLIPAISACSTSTLA